MRGSRPPCPQATPPFLAPSPVQRSQEPGFGCRPWTSRMRGAGGGRGEHPALLSTVGQAGADRRNRLSLSSPGVPPVTGGLWQKEGWSQAPSPPIPHPRFMHHKPGAPRSKAGPNVCTKRSPF